jgi:hypothetical protein
MKTGRDDLAPNVALVSSRFNEVTKELNISIDLFIHFFSDVSTGYYRNLNTTKY